MHHGHLLAAGNPKGADGFSIYDAACYIIAWRDRQWSSTEFTLNPEGTEALLRRAGPLGGLLTAVELAEHRDVSGLVSQLDALQLTPAQFTLVSFEAHQWMLTMVTNVRGSNEE